MLFYFILFRSVHSKLESAVVTPILKKLSLNQKELNNYRLVSKLYYVSKLIVEVFASRFTSHCDDNSLMDQYQSAYRSYHSTETALIKVQNNSIQADDQHAAAILV